MRGIDKAHHLRIGGGKIDRDVAALLGDLGADRDVGGAEAVVIQPGGAFVDAVLPARDDVARVALGGLAGSLIALALESGIPAQMADKVLRRVQRFDPIGCGSRGSSSKNGGRRT